MQFVSLAVAMGMIVGHDEVTVTMTMTALADVTVMYAYY